MADDKNTTFLTEIYDNKNPTEFQSHTKIEYIMHVSTCIIISIGLPLTLVTIYALYSLVRKDQVAPIYVINLFITDFFQLCCMIVFESTFKDPRNISTFVSHVHDIYPCLLLISVGFMVCVSLERYLVIAHPLWYRFRRNIKISVAVCVVVWVIPAVLFNIVVSWFIIKDVHIILSILLIIPFPLFVFFLVGTLRALSTSVSVSSEEKRRIVGVVFLVLLIYTLLFVPSIILFLQHGYNDNLIILSIMFFKLSPLADLTLYIFIRKESVGKFLAAACCCKMGNNENHEPAVNVDDI